MVHDMTKGNILPAILRFFFPMLFGNLFQQLYNMADSIIVGRFVGIDALAAVGSTGSLNFLVIGFVIGVSSGFCIPVSRYFGAGDWSKLRHCLANSVYLSGGISVVLTAVVMASARWFLTVTNTPANIFDDAYHYIMIIFAGIIASMFYNLLAGVLRALGDSRTPLIFLVVASVLNILLDLLFIRVFFLGAAGAAYATVIAQAISGLLCLWFIVRRFPAIHPVGSEWKADPAIMAELLHMGLPMALQFSITAVGTIILQSAVNLFGSGVVAAVTAAYKVQILLTQPMETLGITMATFCSQNLGAEQIDRIRSGIAKSTIVCMIYCVIAWVIAYYGGVEISLLFIDAENREILTYVREFLRVNAMFFPLLGILFLLRNSLQGLGYAFPAMTAGVFELAARTIVAFFLVEKLQYLAICLANPVAWAFADCLLIPVYLYDIRMLKRRFPGTSAEKKPKADPS